MRGWTTFGIPRVNGYLSSFEAAAPGRLALSFHARFPGKTQAGDQGNLSLEMGKSPEKAG